MLRHSATASPSVGLWASVESSVRLTLATLSRPGSDIPDIERIEGEQDRIRRTARYWLLG